MTDPEETSPPGTTEETPVPPAPAPAKKPRTARASPKKSTPTAEEAPKPKAKAPKETPPPKRPTLTPEIARLLAVRRGQLGRRPRFTRQASYRYWRIGRDESWRKPRGLQSKQRRHYGYRSTIVSIGFRTPRLVRGRTPSGFRPVLVETVTQISAIDPAQEAAIIARTVGTLKRLVLEEAARKRGVHVLNPITKETRET